MRIKDLLAAFTLATFSVPPSEHCTNNNNIIFGGCNYIIQYL